MLLFSKFVVVFAGHAALVPVIIENWVFFIDSQTKSPFFAQLTDNLDACTMTPNRSYSKNFCIALVGLLLSALSARAEVYPDGACPILALLPFTSLYVLNEEHAFGS